MSIGPEEVQALRRLRKHAEENPFTLEDMMGRMENPEAGAPGDNPRFVTYIPDGFRVVFTIEEHLQKSSGLPVRLRHLSVSAPDEGMAPNFSAMQMIMQPLGFEERLLDSMAKVHVYMENNTIVNVLEEYHPESKAAGHG